MKPDEIKDYVRENLARYKIPRDVEFLNTLPRNATGKVLRGELTGPEIGIFFDDDQSFFSCKYDRVSAHRCGGERVDARPADHWRDGSD